KPVDLPFLNARRLQREIDLFSAAMNDHERHRGASNRPRDRPQKRRVLEELSTDLEDGRHRSPVRSSSPSMTFMFCTAWPAAPFTRLSITETSTARPDA